MKCVRIIGQGVPVRLTDQKAREIVEIDKDGEYCSKSFFKRWYAAVERASARHEQDCLWPLCDCGELEACRRDVKGGDPPGTRPKPART